MKGRKVIEEKGGKRMKKGKKVEEKRVEERGRGEEGR